MRRGIRKVFRGKSVRTRIKRYGVHGYRKGKTSRNYFSSRGGIRL